MGDAERLLNQLGLRYAAIVHLAVGVCCGSIGLLSAPPTARWTSAALAALVIVWGSYYSRRLLKGSAPWLVAADVLIVVLVGWSIGLTDRPEVLALGAGWVISWASFVCVSYQIHTTPAVGFGATAVVAAALAAGLWQVVPQSWPGWVVSLTWLLISAALCRWMWVLVQRGSKLADLAADAAARARRDREISRAVRADEQRAVRMLHDTASTTLMMIGAGCVRPADDWLADQAARDLRALHRVREVLPAMAKQNLRQALEDVISGTALKVRLEAPDQLLLPSEVTTALAEAVREALTNSLRHSGARTAVCQVIRLADGWRIEVVDQGVGFDTECARTGRRGITHSIVGTVEEVGATARIISRPGHGTVVRLEWDRGARPESGPDEAAAWQADLAVATSTGLQRQLRRATLTITAAVLFFLTPATFAGNVSTYRLLPVQLVAFGILTLAFAAGVVAYRRNLTWSRWRWPAVGVLATAGVLSSIGIEPTAHALASYWFVGTVPWLVLIVLGEQLAQVVVIILAHHIFAVARMLVSSSDGLTSGFLPGMITSVGYPLAIAVAAWTLAALAHQAAGRRREAEQSLIADQFAAQAHANRRQRYADLSLTARPLLTGLAARTLDPQDPIVRRRCAVEAARMRRLFAESDEAPDPLLHELRACADLADRRGVVVTLASTGSWPDLPKQIRRDLTEAPMMLLATAFGQARVTVSGTGDSVAVSVVADSPDLDVPPPRDHTVGLSVTRSGQLCWVEVRWQNESSR